MSRIDGLLEEFTSGANRVESDLSSMLTLVKGGRVPPRADVQALEEKIEALQRAFDSIQHFASEVVGAEDAPSADASAFEYAEAIGRTEALRVKERLAAIEGRLRRFVSVKSLVLAFEEALKPYQSAAQDLLAQLGSDAAPSPDALEEATEAQGLFLEAMTTEDFDSDTGMELMERLEAHYSSKVQRGLLLDKYYIEKESCEAETSAPVQTASAEPEAPIAPHEAAAEEREDAAEVDCENAASSEPSADDSSDAVPGEAEAEDGETYDFPETVQANVKIKAKAASANAFKNDILKLSREVYVILPLFTNLGALTADLVYIFGRCMGHFSTKAESQESVQKVLDALVSKGILASYSLACFDDPIYCLTAYGYESLTKRSIAVDMKRVFAVSFGKYRLIGRGEMPTDTLLHATLHNDKLALYFSHAALHFKPEVCEAVAQSISWEGDHYTVSVLGDDSVYYTCRILAYGEELPALLESTNVLICDAEAVDTVEAPAFDGSHKLFALNGEGIHLWDSGWVRQTLALECGLEGEAELIDEPTAPAEGETTEGEAVECDVGEHDPDDAADAAPDAASVLTEAAEPISAEAAAQDAPPIEDATAPDLPDLPDPPAVDDLAAQTAVVDDGTAQGLCRALLESKGAPSDAQFVELIQRLVRDAAEDDAHLKEALLLAHAASFDERAALSRCAYDQLALAVNMGLGKKHYSGTALVDAFGQELALTESCKISAYLYAMLFPYQAYDHTLRATTQGAVKEYEFIFPHFPRLKALFNAASCVCDVSPEGFSESILDALSDQDVCHAHVEKLKRIAQPLLNEPKIKAYINGIPELVSSCFGKRSDLHMCMETIANDAREDRELVLNIFAEYCEENAGMKVLSELAIDSKIDSAWKVATCGKRTSGINLEYQARKQVFNEFVQRLELIRVWLEYSGGNAIANIPAMKKRKNSILKELRLAKDWLRTEPQPYGAVILWMLDTIQYKLDNREREGLLFSDLLRTGLISVDDSGLPILIESMHSVKYAEPWRLVLKHIVAEKLDFKEATSRIFDRSSSTFDNLHQLEMIGKHLGSGSSDYVVTAAQVTEATASANRCTEKFRDELELAYTYNRIYEVEKESLTALLDLYQEQYFECRDFGCWENFLQCLRQQVDDLSNTRREALKLRLDACAAKLRAGERSNLLDKARELLTNDANFAVTEEYCNRFELGERELTEELTAALHDPDSFTDFLSDKVFQPLYAECSHKSGQRLDKFGLAYVAARYPAGWTSRHKEDSKRLLSAWPNRRGNTSPQQIATFFAGLGFAVRGAERVSGKSQEVYRLNVEPAARNMPDYIHPISAFGTQIKSPLNVVVLYGNSMAQELVDTISSLNIGGMSIVLIDYPLDLSVRRQIAEIFHTKMSGMNPFLLIDQVLALHLAMHQDTERLPIMLKCTLPYTYYQPFVRDGGPTADEMFCGRAAELATIIDPNGACIVYGGRQVGKTALLERAQSLFAKPEAKAFAVYSNILKLESEEAVVCKLVIDIRRMAKISISDCTSLSELGAQLDAMFRGGAISSMLLLIDEADDFLASISKDDYLPLQPLVDLKRESKNQFKFVLAGLHNVCRAKNATARNGIFGQLGQPLCVKPLSPTDALQLISRPLRYLGFQVDQYPHLETILTNTNYYPGILQFFGYTLVQTMTSQYGRYYRAVDGNPPYTLRKEQLGAILNSADLNSSIKDKFRWSLELDPRYFMLARCIVMLYYENSGEPTSSQLGFSVEQIMDMVALLDIHCLEHETIANVTNLLDEMVDMGILSRPNETQKRYRLRRKSFTNIIGADIDTLLDDIVLNNEEGC